MDKDAYYELLLTLLKQNKEKSQELYYLILGYLGDSDYLFPLFLLKLLELIIYIIPILIR